MGTPCEIYIKDKYTIIQLWKHFDGYPEYMFQHFINFVDFALKIFKNQEHKLAYAVDVSSLLIAYDYEYHKKFYNKQCKKDPALRFFMAPDIRPRGSLEDADYIYILDITTQNSLVKWRLLCFDVHDFLPNEDTAETLKPYYKGIIQMTVNEFKNKVRKNDIPDVKPTKEEIILVVQPKIALLYPSLFNQ
jgi:hypothetical protein